MKRKNRKPPVAPAPAIDREEHYAPVVAHTYIDQWGEPRIGTNPHPVRAGVIARSRGRAWGHE